MAKLPSGAQVDDVIDASIHEHLRALHEMGDHTSANVRIFGQVPEAVREARKPTRRTYEAYWEKLLTKAAQSGDLHPGTDPHLVLALLISSLNATLEWFDPNKEPVEPGGRCVFGPGAPGYRHQLDRYRLVAGIRFATSSSITSVAPPPMDCTRASRTMRAMVLSWI